MTYRIKSKCDGGGDTYMVDNMTVATHLDFSKILNQVSNATRVDIITYNLKNVNFVKELLREHKTVRIVLNPCSKGYYQVVKDLQRFSNNIKIYPNNHIHSKWILADPNFVYTGSQNISDSDSFENIVIFVDKIIYSYYHKIFNIIINNGGPYNIKPNNNVVIKNNYSNKNYFPYFDNQSSSVKKVTVKFATDGMVNWNQKFNGYHNRDIIITTLTIPSFEYANLILNKLFKQRNKVAIIANDMSINKLNKLKLYNPKLAFCTCPNIHAKLVLVDGKNKIVWSSSQNFGSSKWIEDTINIKDGRSKVYSFYKHKLAKFLGININN